MTTSLNYDALAQKYAQNRHLHPGVLKGLLVMGRLDSHSRVLEVGCGTGNYIEAIQAEINCRCWGLDPSAGMLASARQQTRGVLFYQGQAEHLATAPNLFDLLFSVDVIHHARKRTAYLQQAYHTLKPGGKLCTVTDSESIIRRRQPLATYFPETIAAELKRYPSIGQLETLMAQAGFKAIIQETVEFAFELTNIQPYQNKVFSALHIISEDAFQAGLSKMKTDLSKIGSIPCVSRYLLLWGIK